MTAQRDPDRLIQAFISEGQTELADPVYDAVRAGIERRQQRAVIGPWRMPFIMNKTVLLGLGAAAVVVALILGTRLLGSTDSGSVGGAPSAAPTASPSPTSVGGTVKFLGDGGTTTTTVDAVIDGASVSGTAVTTFSRSTHNVRLECAARDGDTWAFGGTSETTTVPGERAGDWSAVIVKDGQPQRIGIWLSDAKKAGIDCAGWLAAIDLATIDPSNFQPVESGALVPPPDLAS